MILQFLRDTSKHEIVSSAEHGDAALRIPNLSCYVLHKDAKNYVSTAVLYF